MTKWGCLLHQNTDDGEEMNYYNDTDSGAAYWLESLINEGLIPPGHVDRRSIADVQSHELTDYTQCHFFAGIAGWSLALQLAVWPSTRPVWTGSCPCQPFSSAGRGKGTDDERHLWPEFHRLIRECSPPTVFGEQVSGKAGVAWLSGVQADLEASDYAVGAITFPAGSIGSPHQRQRLYWGASRMADTEHNGRDRSEGDAPKQGGNREDNGVSVGDSGRLEYTTGQRGDRRADTTGQTGRDSAEVSGSTGGMANTDSRQRNGRPAGEGCQPNRKATGREQGHGGAASDSETSRLADTHSGRLKGPRPLRHAGNPAQDQDREVGRAEHAGWSGAEWIECRDGKVRPAQPSLEQMADGLPGDMVPGGYSRFPVTKSGEPEQEARTMRLKGYGNAIVPQQAALFIEAFEESGND